MLSRVHNQINKHIQITFTLLTIAVLTFLTPSAYGIGIEYQPDPTNNEILQDENNLKVILVILDPGNISYDEKI